MHSLREKLSQFFNKIFRRKSIVLKWTISYVCLLIIAVSINIILFSRTRDVIQSEITKENQFMVSILKDNIDMVFQNTMDLVGSLTNNRKIGKLAISTGEQFESNYPLTSEVASDLLTLEPISTHFSHVYLYFEQADLIITPTNVMSSSTYFKGFHKELEMTYPEWKDLITEDSNNLYIKKFDKSGAAVYFYVSSLPFSLTYGSKQYASLVVVIDEKVFLERGQKLQQANAASVFIVDKSGNIIQCSDRVVDIDIDFRQIESGEDFVRYSSGHEDYLVSFVKSGNSSGALYVSVIPYSNFWGKLIYVQRFNVLGIVSMIIICGLLTLYFVRKNYDPIGSIMNIVHKYNKELSIDNENEYNIIQKTLSEAVTSNNSISQKLEKQERAFLNNYLARLLNGRITDFTSVPVMLANHMIEFSSDSFAVMIFSVYEVAEFLSDGREADSYDLIYFIMTNVIEELVGRKHCGIMVDIDDYMTCIVNFAEGTQADVGLEELKEINVQAETFFAEQFGIRYHLACSAVHNGIHSIPTAYNEALVLFDYKAVVGGSNEIFYHDIASDDSLGKEKYTIEMEYLLMGKIKMGEQKEAIELADKIIKSYIEATASPVVIKCAVYGIVNTIIRVADENGISFDDNEALEAFSRTSLVSEMQNLIVKMIMEVCQSSQRRSGAAEHMSKRVISYIEQNYADPNLCVTGIAEHFNMNPSYLSSAFKEYTGEGILKKINNIRMDRAVEILKNSYMSVNEVSIAVGYLNVRTFSGLFKKRYGITPSAYKETI